VCVCVCVCMHASSVNTHIFFPISKCVSVEFSVKGVYSKYCVTNFILSCIGSAQLVYDLKITTSTTVYWLLINIIVLVITVCSFVVL
jgi:hypothetical protein